jgi:hypothetical protein
MDRHFSILAALYIAYSALSVLAAAIVFAVITGGGLLSRDPTAIAVTTTVAMAIAWFLVMTAVPGLIGGVGLLKRKPWSRILLIVLGILHLLDFPLGTALGVYTLIVLTKPEAAALLRGSPAA